MAIYNYEETGKAILDSILASYETLKECDKNPPVCAELISKITGDIAQTLVPVSKIGQGAKLAASARVAAIAETRVGQAIVKAGAKLGFQSGAELKTLINRIQEVSPCSFASHPVEKNKFKELWATIMRFQLVPKAYGNLRAPCRSLKLADAKELVEGLSKVGGIDSKKALDAIYGAKDAIGTMGPKKFGEILKTPKELRKLPDEYLPQTYIKEHLGKFDGGGSYLVPQDILDNPAIGRELLGFPDNSQYIMPKAEMDELLRVTGGDIALIEKELGIPQKSWQYTQTGKPRKLVRIDIDNPRNLNLRMPSGVEMGTNNLWLPGGKLPTGRSEAVINRIPKGSYTERPI